MIRINFCLSQPLKALLGVVSVVSIFAGRASAEPDKQEVTFHFRPPDGTVPVEKSETTRMTSSADGTNNYGTERNIIISESTFQSSPRGYTISRVAKDMQGEVNRKPFVNPVTKLLIGTTNTLTLSPKANLLDLQVDENLVPGLKRILPTNVYPEIDKEFNSQAQFKSENNNWQFNVTRFAERTVKPGDYWTEEDTTIEPKRFLLTKISEVNQVGSQTRVMITSMESSNKQEVEALNPDLVGARETNTKFLAVNGTVPFERMIQVRSVDAATMLPIADLRITVTFKPTRDGKGWLRKEILNCQFEAR